ncbi:MAG: DUF488 domain-containing protein [Deltaproteobacteria bacterium]|nr:DUF488 domain-containing protein [Deltaproteobacteria bacterium]
MQDKPPTQKITVFTIGFTKKSARVFFELLQRSGIRRLIDIRLNNESQLAGFTKKDDIEYFLKAIANIEYSHRPEFAPSKEILDGYKKKKITWADYEQRFQALLRERKVEDLIAAADLEKACLLCSEPKPGECHRRLVAEYLRSKLGDIEIRHL